MIRSTLFICLLAAPVWGVEPVKFSRDVLPILVENCFACHGFDEKNRKADLRLDERQAALDAIVPGDPEKSELWLRVIASESDEIMPPPKTGKHISVAERDILRRWIEQGAEYEPHWAFQKPAKNPFPEVAGVTHPVDRFVQVRLKDEGLNPSPPAERATLIRRVSLDLTGLPPTPEAVAAFEKDGRADAYERLVDGLLASPHYGERWGRWWLDQARYSDSNGYSIDAPRQIWKFRDWVVEAFNADMPFDQFTIEQLAGDLLPEATEAQRIATGFHRNTQINQEGGIDKEQFRIDSVFDRVATTGTVWLGLTIGCAQCHDHKFDPIEQREFYQLFAFLNNQNEPVMKVNDPHLDLDRLNAEHRDVLAKMDAHIDAHLADLEKWEEDLGEEGRKKRRPETAKALNKPVDQRTPADRRILFKAMTGTGDEVFNPLYDRHLALEEIFKSGTTTLVLAELSKPRRTTVFINGDFTRPGEEVQPGTPKILHPFRNVTGEANRLDLAHWITSSENPLTARVIMNRVWQHYFGAGLVETENDFGLIGSQPTHPELLDWLACEFIERGWSLKEMHRLLVTSQTYQQTSVEGPDLREKDANNRWLARQKRLRLDAEIVRDVALTASGLLAPMVGGPPVFPPIPDGVMGQGQVKRQWKASEGADRYRRALYTFLYRATPPPALAVFDAPEGFSTCTRRNRSNTPLQALTLMNDQGFFEFALALEKIIAEQGLEVAFQRCTSRRPDASELAVLKRLSPLNAARALLNLDETITRE